MRREKYRVLKHYCSIKVKFTYILRQMDCHKKLIVSSWGRPTGWRTVAYWNAQLGVWYLWSATTIPFFDVPQASRSTWSLRFSAVCGLLFSAPKLLSKSSIILKHAYPSNIRKFPLRFRHQCSCFCLFFTFWVKNKTSKAVQVFT